MNHLLIISSSFAPWGGPGGMRATKLTKVALSRGIKTTVLTTAEECRHTFDDPKLLEDVQGASIIRVSDGTDYSARLFISKFGYQALRVADRVFGKSRKTWAQACYASAVNALAETTPDVVYATPPGSEVVWLASELASCWNVPYVMDFRDPPWEIGMPTEDLEGYLASCELASFNTPPATDRVQAEHPGYAAKIECWTNGVEEPSLAPPPTPSFQSGRSILFGGGMYYWVVDALRALTPWSTASKVDFDVYAFAEKKRAREIASVRQLGIPVNEPVSSASMIQMMSQCWANLVVMPPEFQISSKLYLTIASGRPVLIFGRSKSSDALLPGVPGIFHFDASTSLREFSEIEKQIDDYDMQGEWSKRYDWLASRSWPFIFDGIFGRFL